MEGARLPLPAWLGHLVRDELRVACREHGVDASSRSRSELADLPRRGDIVVVRYRQYLVEAVHAAPAGPDATRVCLVGLDDDNQGRRTDVLWELELGARVLDTYDERMFHQLVARDRWHGVLLGKPAPRLADEDAEAPLLGQERLQKLRLDLAPR